MKYSGCSSNRIIIIEKIIIIIIIELYKPALGRLVGRNYLATSKIVEYMGRSSFVKPQRSAHEGNV